jgi:hypothetical protein
MTIFDTLRYPISWPPTEAEIANIPYPLLEKWARYTLWKSGMDISSHEFPTDIIYSLCKFYKSASLASDSNLGICRTSIYEVELLRKMIRDLE